MFQNAIYDLIGHSIVLTGRAIKVNSLENFIQNNFEITPEQFLVLNLLNERECNQNKLCDELGKDKSNMARIISVLKDKDLITKTPSSQKRQENTIKITKKGRDLRDKIAPVMQKIRQDYMNGIDEDEIYTCLKVLSRIRKNIDKGLDDDSKEK